MGDGPANALPMTDPEQSVKDSFGMKLVNFWHFRACHAQPYCEMMSRLRTNAALPQRHDMVVA